MGAGLPSETFCIEEYDFSIYAGGRFIDARDSVVSGLIKFVNHDWLPVIDPSMVGWDIDDERVMDIAIIDQELWIAGSFNTSDVFYAGNNVSKVDELGGWLMPIGQFDDVVNAIDVLGIGQVPVIGGAFTAMPSWGPSQPLPRLALLDLAQAVPNVPLGRVKAWPNPASSSCILSLGELTPTSVNVVLVSSDGRLVDVPYRLNGNEVSLEVGSLASGMYGGQVFSGDVLIGTTRIVVAR
jgi:hypothetical protein